jgi:hypothetical protein
MLTFVNPSLEVILVLQDPDDLPFRKGEILTIVSKDEENWWTARNALGQTGSIPVPYVAKVNYIQLQSKYRTCMVFKRLNGSIFRPNVKTRFGKMSRLVYKKPEKNRPEIRLHLFSDLVCRSKHSLYKLVQFLDGQAISLVDANVSGYCIL